MCKQQVRSRLRLLPGHNTKHSASNDNKCCSDLHKRLLSGLYEIRLGTEVTSHALVRRAEETQHSMLDSQVTLYASERYEMRPLRDKA